jgi:hypothetical protein
VARLIEGAQSLVKTCIAEPQRNDADSSPVPQCRILAEVEIEGDDGTALRVWLGKYLAVGEPLQTLFPQVSCIETL